MRKDRYKKQRFHSKSLTLVLAVALSCVLLVCGVVGGTLAWLTDESDEVKNEFTPSDINITLEETTKDFKMIPGWTIAKDPIVTVKAGSEDCYVFLKVEKSGGDVTVDGETYSFDNFIAYNIDLTNWTKLDGVDGVYYCKYTNRNDVDIQIKVLAGGITPDSQYSWGPNEVLILPTVTKEMMNAIDGSVERTEGMTADAYNAAVKAETDAQPTLTFTAYAFQYWKQNGVEFKPDEAWTKIFPGNAGTSDSQ